MEILATLVVIIYAVSLLFIFCYSIIQLSLLLNYLRHKRSLKKNPTSPLTEMDSFPLVTVQLPVYNELYVVERLMEAVSQLHYPKDRLQMQLLDDSTDETSDLIRKKTYALKEAGFHVQHIQREIRKGFKAGALAHGLESATGKFIAIFDADFVPQPDFLLQTLPEFLNAEVGVVQTRWEHLNKNHSIITRLQAFGLDAHFTLEQTGRNVANHFINFNGTAGIWRKKCIEDAGGWQSDTLTEDLDLSYRAQLRGWKFVYKEDIGTPAELPVAMNALKNQQFRWNKGAAECVRKNLGSVLRKRGLRFSTKLHAVFHLMNSTIFIFILITALLSIPMLFIKEAFPQFRNVFFYASFFLISLLILGIFYYVSQAQQDKKFPNNLGRFLLVFPLFLSVSMGLALHNAIAVLQGYFGMKSPFLRTPKFNVQNGQKSWKQNKYLEKNISRMTIAEGVLAVYFISGIMIAFILKDFGLLPFHLLLAFGFSFVCYYSFAHSKDIATNTRSQKWKFRMARG
ncbi:MAG: glycosyltransferase [Chitinophagales bacterium]